MGLFDFLGTQAQAPQAAFDFQRPAQQFATQFAQSPITGLGLQNLENILRSGGRTDPQLFNRQVTSIERGTQQGLDETRGELARAGIQNAGLSQALLGAQRASGAGRIADLEAQEARTQEERLRQDLGAFLAMLAQINQLGGQGLGVEAQIANQNAAANAQMIGAALGAAGSGLGAGLMPRK